MTSTLDLLNHPRISCDSDGTRHYIRYGVEGWGSDVVGEYWQEPRPDGLPDRASWDGWCYKLAMISGKGGTFSHVTEQGCKIMILRHMIECDLIQPREDNAHLDERNAEIAAEILDAWNSHTGRPRVDDFVKMPNGALRRCSHGWDNGMQTSDGGSYSISTSGRASMSGSLYPSQLWEYFKDTGEIKAGRFWFFSHGIAGAGRGVDFYLPCRVYQLEPFAMSEEQARAHPVAVKAGEFWG